MDINFFISQTCRLKIHFNLDFYTMTNFIQGNKVFVLHTETFLPIRKNIYWIISIDVTKKSHCVPPSSLFCPHCFLNGSLGIFWFAIFFLDTQNGILLPKLFWPTVRKNYSSDWEKLLKFEAEGREFSKILRSLEQFIQTVKGQNNFL